MTKMIVSRAAYLNSRKYFWLLLWIVATVIILIQVVVDRKVHDIEKQSIYIKSDFQTLQTSNGTFKLLQAFYDVRRFYKIQKMGVVKLTGLIDKVDPSVKTFCQLWFEDSDEPITSPVVMYRSMWPAYFGFEPNQMLPFFIECLNPFATEGKFPTSVSLVENPDDAPGKSLKLTFNPLGVGEKRKTFAVCTKSYFFKADMTMQLVEWIEILLILGADKIFIAAIEVHPEMAIMFDHYAKTGKVEVEILPPPDDNISVLQNEVFGFNHCLYRNMYKYSFVLILDVDELILPHREKDKDLADLLNRSIKKNMKFGYVSDCYTAQHVLFLLDNNHANEIQADVPRDFLFLQHIYRAANFCEDGIRTKSFQNAETTEVAHNHYALECLGKMRWCDAVSIGIDDGKLQHYRGTCDFSPEQCDDYSNNTVKDITLWRFREQIIENVEQSLKGIEFLRKSSRH